MHGTIIEGPHCLSLLVIKNNIYPNTYYGNPKLMSVYMLRENVF